MPRLHLYAKDRILYYSAQYKTELKPHKVGVRPRAIFISRVWAVNLL